MIIRLLHLNGQLKENDELVTPTKSIVTPGEQRNIKTYVSRALHVISCDSQTTIPKLIVNVVEAVVTMYGECSLA